MTSLASLMQDETQSLSAPNLETLEAGVKRLDSEMGQLAKTMQMSGGYSAEMTKLFQSELKSAFRDLVFEGAKLSDVLRDLAISISNKAFSQAVTPVIDIASDAVGAGLGSLVSAMLPFSANGMAGAVPQFANGGIIDQTTRFRSPSGDGILGENGPEAIMPLSRDADGRLGLRGAHSQTHVNIHIETANLEGFRKSKGQLMSMTKKMINGR